MENTKKPVLRALSRLKIKITGLSASKNPIHGDHRPLRNLLTGDDKTWAASCDRSSRARHFSCFPTLSRLVGRVSAPHGKLSQVYLTRVKSNYKPRLSNRALSWLCTSANEHRDVAQRLHSCRWKLYALHGSLQPLIFPISSTLNTTHHEYQKHR